MEGSGRTFGADAHLVLCVVLEEALDTAARELLHKLLAMIQIKVLSK